MRRSPSTWRCPRETERGSTLVEVAVTLAVLALLFSAAMPLVSLCYRTLSGALELAADASRAARFEASLRAAAERVRIPHWWNDLELEAGVDDALSLPYLDGRAGKALTLRHESGTLLCGAGPEVAASLACGDARVSAVRDADGRIVGIRIAASLRDARSIVVLAALGAVATGGAQ